MPRPTDDAVSTGASAACSLPGQPTFPRPSRRADPRQRTRSDSAPEPRAVWGPDDLAPVEAHRPAVCRSVRAGVSASTHPPATSIYCWPGCQRRSPLRSTSAGTVRYQTPHSTPAGPPLPTTPWRTLPAVTTRQPQRMDIPRGGRVRPARPVVRAAGGGDAPIGVAEDHLGRWPGQPEVIDGAIHSGHLPSRPTRPSHRSTLHPAQSRSQETHPQRGSTSTPGCAPIKRKSLTLIMVGDRNE